MAVEWWGRQKGLRQGMSLVTSWICEKYSCFSSFHRDYASWENSPTSEIKVPTVRFESILAKYGVPHFCKIDIQGNELLCLQDFGLTMFQRFFQSRLRVRKRLMHCMRLVTRSSN
jgi:FkbM family methyltransferase